MPELPVDIFASAVRRVESSSPDGDYNQRKGMIRGVRIVGAYGIAEDDWPSMAAEAGIPGARWQDARAQDMAARATFERLYRKYGDWRWVASAWKAGEQKTDVLFSDPGLIEFPELIPVKSYVDAIMTNAREAITTSQDPVHGVSRETFKTTDEDFNPLGAEEFGSIGTTVNPNMVPGHPTSDVEEVLRRRLYAMRERVRPPKPETVSPAEVGTSEAGTGLPGIPTGRLGIFGTPEVTPSASQIIPAPSRDTRVSKPPKRRARMPRRNTRGRVGGV